MVKLLTDEKEKASNENPYGGAAKWKTIRKEFSDAAVDGIIRIEIDKGIIEKHDVTKVKVKILNIDYESSLYSKEVSLKNARGKKAAMTHKPFENSNVKDAKKSIKTVHHNIEVEKVL